MLRKILILTVVVISTFWACNLQAGQITSRWVAAEGFGFWEDANNWTPPTVPDNDGNTFAVIIDGGSGDKKQVGLLQNRTINQLDCYGNVWLKSRTPYDIELILVDVNGLTNYGNLRIRGGAYNEISQFKIQGSVKNQPGAILESFGVKFKNDFYNAIGATLWVKYESGFHGGVHNEGAINIYPFSEMGTETNIINAGQIQVWGGLCAAIGLLDNDVNGVIEGLGVVHSGQSIENRGGILASGGSFVLHSDGSVTNSGMLKNDVGATLRIEASITDANNQGTIEVNADGSVVFDCNLVNEPNGIIKLLGGTLAATTITQSANANFAGFGTITGAVIIDPNGLIELTGPTNIVGDVNIPAGATLEISDGTTLITGQTTCNGTIHMKGGYIIPQGGLSGDCNVIWEPGTYTNAADFNLDGQVNFKDFAYVADTWLWQTEWSTQ